MTFSTPQPQLLCQILLLWVMPTVGPSPYKRWWVDWFEVPTWDLLNLAPAPLFWDPSHNELAQQLKVGNARLGFWGWSHSRHYPLLQNPTVVRVSVVCCQSKIRAKPEERGRNEQSGWRIWGMDKRSNHPMRSKSNDLPSWVNSELTGCSWSW